MAEVGLGGNVMDSEVDAGLQQEHEENGDQDIEGVDNGLNTNYDSCDGAIPVHRCEKCENYETLSNAALLAHSAQCLGTADGESHRHRKMFECDICNMKFSNGANMRRHKMRHTGVKPYECRVCQKRFFRKDHLAEHFTTHTKTLPYHCPICNRGFQRQIAMRAHFQNEHVGQHDMIKSCPLCTYRAGSMKNLRVHFFDRHGIDLDNPGPTSSSSNAESSVNTGGCSDSGESTGARSADNATPPMHFLTPHVEISMTDGPPSEVRDESGGNCLEDTTTRLNGSNSSLPQEDSIAGDCPGSPQSADSNCNVPTSSLPSVSLIPIKQELDGDKRSSALMKVSPLKSLLRDNSQRRGPSDANTPSLEPNPWRTSVLKCSITSLQCVFCGIGFPDQTLYFLHKGCHSDSNPWKCNICGEQCCNVYDFNSHLLSKTHQ